MNRERVINELPILVVEDSEEDFDTVKEAASRMGLKNALVHAADADSARQLLAESMTGSTKFSFVLMDQSLPGSNGCVLLTEIRAHDYLLGLPVVMLSGSMRGADRDMCYASGANAYHVKPVRFDAHLLVLQDIFRYWITAVVLPDCYNPRSSLSTQVSS